MSRVTRSQTAAVVANSQQATSQEEMVDINWVFFDKSHPEKCRPRPIEVPRSLFDAKSLNCQNLFANELMKKFNFKAIEDNIEFRKPKETLLSETASEDGWPESIKNIKISFRFIPYTSSFAKALDVDNEDAVHLIVTSEGSYQRRHVVPEAEAVATLKQTNAALYQCLELKIQTARRWTENDVRSNGGIFMRENEQPSTPTPREILDLETKLRGKRSFNTPDDDRDLSIARHYKDHFESTYIRTTEDHASVKSSMEFIAFYVLLRCFHEDASRYKTEESSSLKAHGLKGYLIVPPFFSGQKDCDVLLYRDETHWTFPLFLSCPTMSQLPRQYTPVSDFSVWFGKLDLPLIVAEVVSQKNEEDRYRMLLQAIALARLVFQLRRSESTAHPFIVGIYLTASLNAERYIVMRSATDANTVYISKKDFDLTNQDDAVVFQREMYNLASELETLVGQLEVDKRSELNDIAQQASALKSLHSSGAWSKRTKTQTLSAIPEEHEGLGPQDEDDLGVFDDYNVRTVLDQMGYKVAYVAFGHPNIAPIVSRIDGEMVGCLKFVNDGGQEIEILQYLTDLPSESNHTVRPIRIWSITGGSIIAMPVAGNRITSLINLDTHLWPLITQLFEAVKFMHDHNVAHMDLKPSNILIPSEYGRLNIVDFGVSVRVRNATELRRGCVGTEGYMAPEVGRTKFSPIRADLWSTGKTVQELCMRCRPSPDRDWLLALSNQLLDDDPSKRPMMLEVLQLMLNYKAVETLHGDHIGLFAPISSSLAAVSA